MDIARLLLGLLYLSTLWMGLGIGPFGTLFDYLFRVLFKISTKYRTYTYGISLIPGIGPLISFILLINHEKK